jgi:hypothetical protein
MINGHSSKCPFLRTTFPSLAHIFMGPAVAHLIASDITLDRNDGLSCEVMNQAISSHRVDEKSSLGRDLSRQSLTTAGIFLDTPGGKPLPLSSQRSIHIPIFPFLKRLCSFGQDDDHTTYFGRSRASSTWLCQNCSYSNSDFVHHICALCGEKTGQLEDTDDAMATPTTTLPDDDSSRQLSSPSSSASSSSIRLYPEYEPHLLSFEQFRGRHSCDTTQTQPPRTASDEEEPSLQYQPIRSSTNSLEFSASSSSLQLPIKPFAQSPVDRDGDDGPTQQHLSFNSAMTESKESLPITAIDVGSNLLNRGTRLLVSVACYVARRPASLFWNSLLSVNRNNFSVDKQ